ncbi:hypothetical protein [Nonomuraea dietziae]|uniref:hypothetical protein n=1 Tax=Nonomuraea dietziae TaxID=65515 RepID=UPI0031E03DCC
MRELSLQLSLLDHQVSGRLELKDVDVDCLDLVNRYGPLSPALWPSGQGCIRRR